jgi:3D (Asp-Asp-Asp) domain-containing protein
MVTKCARACIVSGALVGITTPAPPVTVAGNARTAEIRHVEKTIRVPQKHHCPPVPAGREFSARLAEDGAAVCSDTIRESFSVPLPPHAPSPRLFAARSLPAEMHVLPRPPKKPSSSRRRHLGAFAMTAYTQYHNPPQRTASGTLPAVGRTVAVDPNVIPLGTKLHIEGVGLRIAEDTGGKIKGKKLDLYLSSVGACTRFGVRSRQVYILD